MRMMRAAAILGLAVAGSGTLSARQATSAAAQQLFEAGERALAERRYADAEHAYRQLQQLQPGVAEVHAKLGVTYYQEGKFADAVPVLRQALKLKPGLPNLDALLAMSLSELGRYDEALTGLRKTFRQSPDPVLKRLAGLHLQRAYAGLGRDADAVATALELSRAYPKDPEVLYHTGRLFANYAYLQTMRLAAVAPDSVWLHQAAGEANESQQLWDAALEEYKQVLALAPTRPGIHFRMGRVLLARGAQSGDPSSETAALTEFGRELAIDPTNANASYEVGEIHRKAGRLDRAVSAFEAALEAYPDFEEALVGLGRTLVAAGQATAALPVLQKAVALKPTDQVAYYQLARAYGRIGNEDEQQKALAVFQRLKAENTRPINLLTAPRSEVTPQPLDSATPP
jgi:tetratricopeptide (TPR) repeat protein